MHLFDSNNLILLTFDVGKTIDDRQHGSEKTQSNQYTHYFIPYFCNIFDIFSREDTLSRVILLPLLRGVTSPYSNVD